MVLISSNDIRASGNPVPLSNNFLHILRLVTKETMETRNKGEELREIEVVLFSVGRTGYTKNMT